MNFEQEVRDRIAANARHAPLRAAARAFVDASFEAKYSYNFAWLGRPIIQYPQDMVAMQQVIWDVRPDLVIETGIAHGGSLVLSASLLAMLDYCEASENGTVLDPHKARRKVLGIDIDIREHNRAAIDAHPMRHRIEMLQGSSIAPDIVRQVRDFAAPFERVLVCLDSNHTHEHVLAELEAYADLVAPGSYCCVFDTVVEELPVDAVPDRPWARGNNPMTAVNEYLDRLQQQPRSGRDGQPLRYEIDESFDGRLLVSMAPRGYLRRLPV